MRALLFCGARTLECAPTLILSVIFLKYSTVLVYNICSKYILIEAGIEFFFVLDGKYYKMINYRHYKFQLVCC